MKHPSRPSSHCWWAILLLTLAPVAAFAAPASLDGTFGAGAAIKAFYGNDVLRGVTTQPDGKILAAGYVGNSASGTDFALVCYNANGQTDLSFNSTGVVTTPFDVARGYYSTVNGLALQADGKIVVGGNVPSSKIGLARYNADGTLDTTFNGTGIVQGPDGNGDACNAVAVQADGKILAVGGRTSLNNGRFLVLRYNANGSPDLAFNGTGTVTTDFGGGYDQAYGVAVQPNGKIVVAGVMQNGSAVYNYAVARYNANGSLDTTFNGTGTVTTAPFGFQAQCRGVRLQADGKILVVGTSQHAATSADPDTSHPDMTVLRYNANGTLDTTFGGTGTVQIDYTLAGQPAVGQNGNALTVQADGKIVVTGYTSFPLPNGGSQKIAVARLNADGTLDTAFGGTGKVATAIASGNAAANAVTLSGTKIIVAGSADNARNSDFALLSYNDNGTLDSTFYQVGKVNTSLAYYDDASSAVAVMADGKTLTGGYAGTTDNEGARVINAFALARYNANGTRDTAFDGTGQVITRIAPSGQPADDSAIRSLAVGTDGKIVAGGNFHDRTQGHNRFALARYQADGTPDTTFNGSGQVLTTLRTSDTLFGVALLANGKILAAGRSDDATNSSDFALVRYNADGTLDTTFNGTGKVLTAVGSGRACGLALAVQTDGKIVVAGYAEDTNGHINFAVVRYTASGGLDTTFGGTGKVITAVDTGNNHAHSVLVQPDGKIVAAGVLTQNGQDVSAVVRYRANGTLDTTFNGTGKTTAAIPLSNYTHGGLALQTDGKVVVAGQADATSASSPYVSEVAVLRYTAGGAPDTAFNGNGQVQTPFGKQSGGNAVALQSDGKIVVAGQVYDGRFFNAEVLRYLGGN